ncbi:MAG: hypothetical protein M1530_01785 [Candidatus Marsarchaeota archaeon]|nr:hypothetical protein [Candidatus Marsarchaeota archaeon]
MATASGGPDYAGWARQADRFEQELGSLLEELAARLAKSSHPQEVSQAASDLAAAAAQLASELHSADPHAAAEKTTLIDHLTSRSQHLLSALPDALLASEQDALASEMESLHSSLRSARADLELLSLPHVPKARRSRIEASMRARLSLSQRRLQALHERVRGTTHLSHPLHAHLTRIHSAMSSAKAHVLARQQEMMRHQASAAREQAYDEMREFFCQQMAGRIYADGETVQLRSEQTGRVAEWALDDAHAGALEKLLGENSVALVGRLRSRACSFSARFETRSTDSRLHLLIDGGERTVSEHGVSHSMQRLYCSL